MRDRRSKTHHTPARVQPSAAVLGATVEIQRASGRKPELVAHRAMLEVVCGVEFAFPAERFNGRGIVVCGGGEKYLFSTYVLVRMLRYLGCRLPIEVWHLCEREMPDAMRQLMADYGVTCVDGEAVRRVHPARRLGGWELKCFALLHCAFAEVMLLDADNCAVRNPEFLFETREYREHGAIFWPDFTRFAEGQAVWVASGVEYRDEPEFESGQIVIDKARCWRALNVAMHLNEHSEWWYRVVHGDKDTFHLAWRKIDQSYAMPRKPVGALDGAMLQYDFSGKLLFQHRNFAKWRLEGNRHIPGFQLEEECLGFIEELRARWTPGLPLDIRKWDGDKSDRELQEIAADLCEGPWNYERVGLGTRQLEFLPDGTIGRGAARCERWWNLEKGVDGEHATVSLLVAGERGVTFRTQQNGDGAWAGAWADFEKAAVRLSPARKAVCCGQYARYRAENVHVKKGYIE